MSSEFYVNHIRDHMESFSITNIPVPDNYFGRTFFSGATWTVGINPSSPFHEEASLFIDFLAERSYFLSRRANSISAGNEARPALDPFLSKVWDIAISAEAAAEFYGLPWMELENVFREELALLIDGQSAAAEAIQRRWLMIMDR